MSDAKQQVESAAYKALKAAITGADVYQDAPYNAAYPLVLIGDMSSSALPAKGGDADRRVTIAIVTLVEADERAPLLTLQKQIDTTLDGQRFQTADGWLVAFEFESDDAVLSEDGDIYSGVTTYSVLAIAP